MCGKNSPLLRSAETGSFISANFKGNSNGKGSKHQLRLASVPENDFDADRLSDATGDAKKTNRLTCNMQFSSRMI